LFNHHKHEKASKQERQTTIREKALLDTYIMQLIEVAMKADKSEKALNLCDFLQFEKPLRRVMGLAGDYNLRSLAEQMQMILVMVLLSLLTVL
jgi:hypothetical protein